MTRRPNSNCQASALARRDERQLPALRAARISRGIPLALSARVAWTIIEAAEAYADAALSAARQGQHMVAAMLYRRAFRVLEEGPEATPQQSDPETPGSDAGDKMSQADQ